MKNFIKILFCVCLMGTLVGCGSSQGNSSQQNQSKQAVSNAEAVVVYFSATGHTKTIAQSIAEEGKFPLMEIEPAQKYTAEDLNYNQEDCRANLEQNNPAARPKIANDLSSVTSYKTIYIGYPIWWGTNPKIIETFLDSYDLSGKTVYVFATSGGSQIDVSIENLKQEYPQIKIQGGQLFNNGDSKKKIADWLASLK